MTLDPFKVMLSSLAARSLAASTPGDFDRLVDVISEFADREGGLAEGCVGIRDFVVGVHREPGALEVRWIQPVHAQGLRSTANDSAATAEAAPAAS